jgi:polar amino acid transport system permease protein
MTEFTLWDIVRNLLLAVPWTVFLSAIAFVGGGFFGLVLLVIRIGRYKWAGTAVKLYVELFQGTPLLMQLFLVYFGLPKLGIDVPAWLAAAVCLTLYASAFLTDIWRGCVDAVPRGQWDAGASLGLHFLGQLRLVILPQATRLAIPPTVGFLVQLVKSTALASIVGFHELTKTAQILTNATFQPFVIFGLVALIYFVMCYPLTKVSRRLERRLAADTKNGAEKW